MINVVCSNLFISIANGGPPSYMELMYEQKRECVALCEKDSLHPEQFLRDPPIASIIHYFTLRNIGTLIISGSFGHYGSLI